MSADPATSFDFGPFNFQLPAWGAIYSGNASEATACLSEHPERDTLDGCRRWWDHDAAYLRTIVRHHGDERLPTPEWWTLAVAPDLILDGQSP